jgi:hypothetical protein
MIKCDVKVCGKLVEAEAGHSVVFGGKLYDFCDECFQEIDKWIQSTLNEGQIIKQDKPKLPSDSKVGELETWYPPYIIPYVQPATGNPYNITWNASEIPPGYKIEYTATTTSTADLDYFDKYLGKKE